MKMTSAINNHKYSESYWFKLEIILVLIRNNTGGVNEKIIFAKIISFKFNKQFCSKNIKSNINQLNSNKAIKQ